MQENRDLSFDAFRGLAIIAVIAIHAIYRLLSTIGYYSFGICLMHVIILGQVVRAFQKFSVIHSFQPFYQLMLVVTMLAICLALIEAARKLLPEFFLQQNPGFLGYNGYLGVVFF